MQHVFITCHQDIERERGGGGGGGGGGGFIDKQRMNVGRHTKFEKKYNKESACMPAVLHGKINNIYVLHAKRLDVIINLLDLCFSVALHL